MIVKQNSYTTEKFRVLFCTDIPIPESHIVKFDKWLIEICEKLNTSSGNTQYFFIPNSWNSIEVIFDIERFDKK